MNILEKIVAEKRQWIAKQTRAFPLETFRGSVVPSERDFYGVLEARKRAGVPAFILECKKASPSQGLIRADFDPSEIGATYAHYADVISVLCDEPFFSGDFKNIPLVRKNTDQPILCKDFIVDPYQVFLARYFGADAILLMLSVLNDDDYIALANLAHRLNLGILTEADSLDDVRRANCLGARVIGINNRNLRTLKTDLERTRELADAIHPNAVRVAESGIQTHADALSMSQFANAFLVGTSLMREENLDRACRSLIFGNNKVCGLTRIEDAISAYEAGALFGGLIFAEKSPRKISRARAIEIIKNVPHLDFVGVFKNSSLEEIVETATMLNLFAIQLHGNKDEIFAKTLREKLPEKIQIWKAVSAEQPVNAALLANPIFDKLVFDSGNGGTGIVFDWKIIPETLKSRVLIAGGISPENAQAAHRCGCFGLDLNSKVETTAGEKSDALIRKAFSQIRKF